MEETCTKLKSEDEQKDKASIRLYYKNYRIFASEHEFKELIMGKKPQSENEEILALKRLLREKELELKREKMRADFYETMVDIAKEDFNIDLRKKTGTETVNQKQVTTVNTNLPTGS